MFDSCSSCSDDDNDDAPATAATELQDTRNRQSTVFVVWFALFTDFCLLTVVVGVFPLLREKYGK